MVRDEAPGWTAEAFVGRDASTTVNEVMPTEWIDSIGAAPFGSPFTEQATSSPAQPMRATTNAIARTTRLVTEASVGPSIGRTVPVQSAR